MNWIVGIALFVSAVLFSFVVSMAVYYASRDRRGMRMSEGWLERQHRGRNR